MSGFRPQWTEDTAREPEKAAGMGPVDDDQTTPRRAHFFSPRL